MQFKIPHKRSLLCSAISMSLLPISGVSLAQDQVEEVVVTGSFIRRSEGFTQASSVTQLNAADLEAQGQGDAGRLRPEAHALARGGCRTTAAWLQRRASGGHEVS